MPQPCCSMARIAWKCMSEASGWISTKFQTHVLVTFRVHWTLMQMKIQNQKEAPLSIYQWSSLVCTLKPNICPELLTMPPLSSKGKSCGIKCWSPLLTDSRHTPSPIHNSGYSDLQVSLAPTIYYVCMYITDMHAALLNNIAAPVSVLERYTGCFFNWASPYMTMSLDWPPQICLDCPPP